jgi:hypothetical protein
MGVCQRDLREIAFRVRWLPGEKGEESFDIVPKNT